jgi:hypothetical protein
MTALATHDPDRTLDQRFLGDATTAENLSLLPFTLQQHEDARLN